MIKIIKTMMNDTQKDFAASLYKAIQGIPRFLHTPYFLFTLFAFIAFILRFWGLDSYPDALYRDETWNGVEALQTANRLAFLPFYEGSTGREGMLIWLIAIVHMFIDPSVQAVRIAPASIGFITVLAIPFCTFYLMRFFLETASGHKLTDYQRRYITFVALAAMLFLTTSYWHVNYSRITFRAILDPLFSMLACTLVALAYQYPRKFWLAILAGMACGLGIYGYGAFKFTIFLLTFIFFYSVIYFRTNVVIPTMIIAVTGLTVAYPLLNYIVHNSDAYFLRLNQVSIFKKPDPLAEFLDALHRLFDMLWAQGDRNLRHNTNKNAQLSSIALIFLCLGIYQIIRYGWSKTKAAKGLRPFSFFMLLWLLTMLVPSALTYDGQPHSLRAIGLIIPLMMIAGFGAGILLRDLMFYSPLKLRQLISQCVLFFILFMSLDTGTEYFIRYQMYPSMKNWFDYRVNEAANHIVKDGGENDFIVVVENKKNPQTYSVIQTFRYLTNFEMDAKEQDNIIRMRDLMRHPSIDEAIIYVPHSLERKVKRLIGDSRRVKRY